MAQSYLITTQQPTGASAAVRFFPLQTYYAASAQTSNGPANSVMLGSGVLENFFVDRKGSPPSAGTTVTYDLLKNNNTATPVASITLNDTQSFGSDVVSSVAYTDGDLFCWRVTPSGSAGNVSWESGCEAISSNDGQALVTGSSTATNSTNPQYANLQQDGLLNVLGGGSIMPFDGSLTKFAMNCSVAPGAGKDFTATLMKRTRATGAVASTGFTIQVADANTQTITTPSPIPFLQGDIFWWENTPTGSPSSSIRISLAALQVPTIPGMSMHSFGTSSNSSASQTVSATILYATVGGGNGSSAETTRVAPNIGTYEMKNLTVWNELTPAGSNEITYNSRANGVDIGTVIMLPSTSPLYLEDNTSQVTVNAYEKIGIKFQRTAGSGTATIGLMSAAFALYKSGVQNHTLSLNDSAAGSDSRTGAAGKIAADVASVLESIFKNPRAIKADTASAADTRIAGISKIISDSVSVAEAIFKGVVKVRGDSASVSDNFSYELGTGPKAWLLDLSDVVMVMDRQKRYVNGRHSWYEKNSGSWYQKLPTAWYQKNY